METQFLKNLANFPLGTENFLILGNGVHLKVCWAEISNLSYAVLLYSKVYTLYDQCVWKDRLVIPNVSKI